MIFNLIFDSIKYLSDILDRSIVKFLDEIEEWLGLLRNLTDNEGNKLKLTYRLNNINYTKNLSWTSYKIYYLSYKYPPYFRGKLNIYLYIYSYIISRGEAIHLLVKTFEY
jgi:hypothetical protein